MKLAAATFLVALAPGAAEAQSRPLLLPSDAARLAEMRAVSPAVPDYGYVLYGEEGQVLRAYGPEAPVEFDETGAVTVQGAEIPPGATVRTEDGPTYLNALAQVQGAEAAETDYTRTLRDVVSSINVGAQYVAENLCPHPARPSNIKVEIVGGFNFYVHGSVTSTVDWDLEKICPEEQ